MRKQTAKRTKLKQKRKAVKETTTAEDGKEKSQKAVLPHQILKGVGGTSQKAVDRIRIQVLTNNQIVYRNM